MGTRLPIGIGLFTGCIGASFSFAHAQALANPAAPGVNAARAEKAADRAR